MCQSNNGSPTHFLFHCPLLNDDTVVLMNIAHAIVSVLPNISDDASMDNILLYGSKALNLTQNNEILNATLVFVQNTGYFGN